MGKKPQGWCRTPPPPDRIGLSNSSDSSVLTCNVPSGIEVHGKVVSVEKVSAKTVYQMLVKRKFSKPTSQKFSQKSSTLVIGTLGAQFIYFLLGHQ